VQDASHDYARQLGGQQAGPEKVAGATNAGLGQQRSDRQLVPTIRDLYTCSLLHVTHYRGRGKAESEVLRVERQSGQGHPPIPNPSAAIGEICGKKLGTLRPVSGPIARATRETSGQK
jgi:hypothetical protein